MPTGMDTIWKSLLPIWTGISIDKTWLLTWESPMHEVDPVYHCTNLTGSSYPGPITLERCLSYVERAPERFVLGFCPDPRLPESLDRLKNAVAMYGVRICGEMKMRMMYDNLDAVRMFRWCGEHGLPLPSIWTTPMTPAGSTPPAITGTAAELTAWSGCSKSARRPISWATPLASGATSLTTSCISPKPIPRAR